MNKLSLEILKQFEFNPCSFNTTSKQSNIIQNEYSIQKRRKSRSQLHTYIMHQKTIKQYLRRKSCCCNECGQLGTFEYKCMNIKGPKPFRRSILTRRASNQQVQSAQPKSFQRNRQQLKKMKTYDESKLNSLAESNKIPLTMRMIQGSMTKLHSYFHTQQQQQIKVYQLNQFTPSCSPKHLKSQKSLPQIQSYLSYRKLDSQLLKPLKLNQQPKQRSQLLILQSTKQHKTLQTVVQF
ncbi:unnamed protein product [Paramecium pentaurelia]|uniref:Uncharacterized protein n=1 Tax=Paramecium pentaurelia TaxID=43138 RepID=A0A8S1UWR4_9CILI|nr:unnamed protein product [Paramecium pentaurelia]